MMTIRGMDHFTVLTTDLDRTVAFYREVLELETGPRPAFPFPGAWLYRDGVALLHVIVQEIIPAGPGVLDHIAFRGVGLAALIARLEARHLAYDLRRLPAGGPGAGVWQLFFHDPNGARVEVDFAADERQTTV
jgi:catechol 2,3-dioxygenase-like lactoylglutathione lyase family enzyme